MLFLNPFTGHAQLLVDNFNRANNTTVGNGWTEWETNSPTAISIYSNSLRMKSNVAGRDYVSRVTPGTYETTLGNNSCLLEWSFNMHQNSLGPNGFLALNHGVAMVLAGSNGDLMQGQGYAVVLGTPGTAVDPLRLVRYNNGLGSNTSLTDVLSVGDFDNQFLGIRVTYDPTTGEWEMFYSASGSSFPNATLAANSAGTAIDAVHAGIDLPYIGCFWNHGTVNSTFSRFDNIRVPHNCSSRVFFASAEGSVNSNAGTVEIPLALENPHMANSAWVYVDLINGDGSIIDGAVSSVVPFGPGETSAVLQLNMPENGGCVGDRELTFEIVQITGGSGTPSIGLPAKYLLTVIDDRSTQVQLLHESFETDGAGTRYQMNSTHANPSSGSYFIRGDESAINAAGGGSVTDMDSSAFMGVCALSGIAANSEVEVLFQDIDILGVGDLMIGMKAGARPAAIYDQAFAQRDHLTIEVNIDGAGWTTAGAFRSHKLNPYVDGWFLQDTDLDGVGDGTALGTALQQFNFPVNMSGATMDLRIRVRSTDALEDIYFDQVQVNGTLCSPIYYSQASGSETDAIWSTMRVGTPAAITVDRNASLVIQSGDVVNASGSARSVADLSIEGSGEFHMADANWDITGDCLLNEGTFTAGTGILRMITDEAASITGGGSFDLYDLHMFTPAGTTTDCNFDIRGTLALEEGIFDATAATVRLRSTVDGTARLGEVGAGADYLGEITMQRRIPAGATNWRFLGSPVAGVTLNDWNDDFFTAGFPGSDYPNFNSNGEPWPSIRWYDEPDPGADQSDGLVGATGIGQAIATGQGFAAWCGTSLNTTSAFIIDVTGVPHIAHTPIQLPISYTDSGNPSTDGYNLVSNPLPAPILFSQIARGADVADFYAIYNPANGSNAMWNGIVGTNGANGTIQSSQAFWMKANGPAVTTTIAENAKTSGNEGALFGDQENELPLVRLTVSDDQVTYSDEALIVFENGTPGVDGLDVPKVNFRHPLAPSIVSHDTQGTDLAINMYGMPVTSVSIPVKVLVATDGNYVIRANEIKVIDGLSCVRLEDLEAGTIFPLIEDAEYEFFMAADPDQAPRFVLHLSTPVQRVIDHVSCHGGNDGSIGITVAGDPVEITLMDVFSGVIDQQTGNMVTFDSLMAGEYTMTVQNNDGCGMLIGGVTIHQPYALEMAFTSENASCSGVDGTLSAEVLGGSAPYTYNWSNGSQNEVLSAGAGVYTLTVTDDNGCLLVSGEQTIAADPGPIAAFQPSQAQVDPGVAVEFTNLSTNADTYIWDMGDGTVIEAPEVIYMFGATGYQTITLTAISGDCSDVTSQQILVGSAVGIEEIAGQNVQVWFDGSNLVIAHDLTGELSIELIDATGRLHDQHTFKAAPARIQLPASDLGSGVWFVRVINNDSNIGHRVVIAR